MPKKKALHSEMGMAVRELCLKENYDPLTALIRRAKETIPVYDKQGKKVIGPDGEELRVPMLVHAMGAKDGWREITNIDKELLNYTRPKLRAMETKASNDLNILVKIQSFGREVQEKVLEMETIKGISDKSKE